MAEAEPTVTAEQLQQHPEIAILIFFFSSLMLIVLVGGASMWFRVLGRWRAGQPILNVEPWSPRVWGFLDLILVALLVIVGQTAGIQLWAMASGSNLRDFQQEADFPLSAMAVGSLSYLVVMLITTLWLMLRHGASLAHIGFTSSKFLWHCAVGVGAALFSLPVVYAIMLAVSLGLDEKYDHPLLNQLMKEGSLAAYLMAAFCAVIVAPLAEEFLFRVLLQGWLQSLPWSGHRLWWLLGASERKRADAYTFNDFASLPSIVSDATTIQPFADDGLGRPTLAGTSPVGPGPAVLLTAALPGHPDRPSLDQEGNPYASAELTFAPGLTPPVVTMPESCTPPLWPVFVSGTLFGLAHWGYGLSFIPLILLGIILGLLYRAKHSIWPSFVVHFVLNLISILAMGLGLVMKSIAQ